MTHDEKYPEHKAKLGLLNKIIIGIVLILIGLFVWFFSQTQHLFGLGVMLFIIFLYLSVLLLTIYFRYPHKNERALFPKKVPTVAVVTYAFNNFKGVEPTVKRLTELEYPIPYTVYVVNDGTMGSLKKYKNVKLITLDKKHFQKGQNIKAVIMNLAFAKLKEENILCTDGDTLPNKDVLMNLTGLLTKDTGAVVGFVKPSNTNNWIEKLQMFEYNLFFAFWNYGFGVMDSIFVVCGPINLINRKKFMEVGGFDVNNITEDAQIAFAFRKYGYKIKHSLDSVAETDVPNTFRKYLRQRIRWYRGGFYTWLKYKNLFFKRSSGVFGTIVFPYVMLLNLIGMAFLAQLIWTVLKEFFTYTIFYVYDVFKYNVLQHFFNALGTMSISEIFKFHIYIPPTTLTAIFTLCAALFLGIIAFSFADFKLKPKNAIVYAIYITLYSIIFMSIYLYSLVLEFIGYKYKW